jgi:hypothetical protein
LVFNNNNNNILLTAVGLSPGGSGHLTHIQNMRQVHAYINEMHCSRSKIPSKKARQAALRGGI